MLSFLEGNEMRKSHNAFVLSVACPHFFHPYINALDFC